jgi:hypothetical protein
MPQGPRFALVYGLLAVSLVGAGFLAYDAWDGGRVPPPRPVARGACWTRGADLGIALYAAARCRFGVARVGKLGFMPYLGARANETLAEVAVLDPVGRASFWVAQYGSLAHGSGVEVRRWTTCPASNIYC